MNQQKLHVVLLADTPGWAYDFAAKAQREILKDEFDFTIEYATNNPNLSYPFDIIHVFSWGSQCHRPYIKDDRPVIREVSSFRWELEEAFGKLSVHDFCSQFIDDATHVVVTSKKLQQKLARKVKATVTPNGFDPSIFNMARERSGAMTVGWAGNIADACKGYKDILVPATQGRFDFQFKGGDEPHAAMGAFYNKLDVLCIASIAEGEPLPLIEGMACGCFPVATDVGLVPELVRHMENGLIVERTPESFREALLWCEKNIDYVRMQGRKNADRMLKTRTWAQTSRSIRRVYLNAWQEYAQRRNNAPQPPSSLTHTEIIDRAKANYESHYIMKPASQTSCETIQGIFSGYEAEVWPLLPRGTINAVLELGVGYGYLRQYLASKGVKRVDGIEINETLHKRSSESTRHVPGTLFHDDALQRLPRLPENTYDAVVAFDLIEHFTLEQAYQLLFQIRCVLRPGGIAVFRTPNMSNFFGGYSAHLDLTHLHCYTEHSFRQLLRIAGFDLHGVFLPFNRRGSGIEQCTEFQRQFFVLEGRTPSLSMEKNFIMWAKK